MSAHRSLGGLARRIVAVHELLDSMRVRHQFGGAIALAWYRNPRATTDIDLNVTLPPKYADPVLGALAHLGVTVSPADRVAIAQDGQARLHWDVSCLDIFFATLEFHEQIAERSREVRFGPVQIPILSPEHLIVCKVVFDRPKDWLDIQEMIAWGTAIDADDTLRRVRELLGEDSEQHAHLAALLDSANGV
jgi:Nucleotidyl transferase AbiEii toxin, Type IV TA system